MRSAWLFVALTMTFMFMADMSFAGNGKSGKQENPTEIITVTGKVTVTGEKVTITDKDRNKVYNVVLDQVGKNLQSKNDKIVTAKGKVKATKEGTLNLTVYSEHTVNE